MTIHIETPFFETKQQGQLQVIWHRETCLWLGMYPVLLQNPLLFFSVHDNVNGTVEMRDGNDNGEIE